MEFTFHLVLLFKIFFEGLMLNDYLLKLILCNRYCFQMENVFKKVRKLFKISKCGLG